MVFKRPSKPSARHWFNAASMSIVFQITMTVITRPKAPG